ncbi:MAG TPA: EamA family transporter [Steroidobacteraceae bacterium]|nr:EamA family transporter [Steroidobacteraceae bacterium]
MRRESLIQSVPAGVLGGAFVLLWCTGYPAARIALDHTAPFPLLVLRFGSAGVIYAALASLAGVTWPRGRAALHSAVVGALSLALQFGAVYLAAARGVNVGLIALVLGTMPIVTALIGLGFGEAVRPLQWLGFAFGFAGVALAVGESIHVGVHVGAHVGTGAVGAGAPLAAQPGPGAWGAVLLGLAGMSAGTLYQKRRGSDVDLRAGLAIQHGVAAALLLPFAAWQGFRFDGTTAAFASLGWLVGINSLTAFALFFVLLRRGAVNQVATLFFLVPPVTALLDYLVLGDVLSVLKVSGIAVAAFGVYLATRSPRGLGQLPAEAEGPMDKEAPQLLAAIHPRQALLRQTSQRTRAVREPAVESIDRRAHGGNFALAPAFVRAQHAERARVLAPADRVPHQLCECSRIEQPEVHALSRERVYHMRCVADERHALRDVTRCRKSLQGE